MPCLAKLSIFFLLQNLWIWIIRTEDTLTERISHVLVANEIYFACVNFTSPVTRLELRSSSITLLRLQPPLESRFQPRTSRVFVDISISMSGFWNGHKLLCSSCVHSYTCMPTLLDTGITAPSFALLSPVKADHQNWPFHRRRVSNTICGRSTQVDLSAQCFSKCVFHLELYTAFLPLVLCTDSPFPKRQLHPLWALSSFNLWNIPWLYSLNLFCAIGITFKWRMLANSSVVLLLHSTGLTLAWFSVLLVGTPWDKSQALVSLLN